MKICNYENDYLNCPLWEKNPEPESNMRCRFAYTGVRASTPEHTLYCSNTIDEEERRIND